MALCGPRSCGCAIQSETLSVLGSGTGNDPWRIEIASAGTDIAPASFANEAQFVAAFPGTPEGQTAWLESPGEMVGYDDAGVLKQIWGNPRSFTPTFSATTTSPNLGTTGTAVGYYSEVGDLVYYQFFFIFGGTGISSGSGTYNITIPVAAKSISGSSAIARGALAIDDNGTGRKDFAISLGSTIQIRTLNTSSFASATVLTNATIGITFAAGDIVAGELVYHSA